MKKILTLLKVCTLPLAILFSCNQEKEDPSARILIRIENYELSVGELQRNIPPNSSETDSTIFAEDFINRWIKTKLLVRKAELNLSPQEKDVKKLLDDYRSSLLIHKYQQKLLEQKYSPLITSSEISKYYEDMINNFILENHIIKGLFIQIPKTAPNIVDLEKWFQSDNSEDLVNIEAYCFQNATKYDVFFDNWQALSQIEKLLPEPIPYAENTLKYRDSYTTSDSIYNYYISIKEFKLKKDIAPLPYVEDKIKAILLNKKRLEFIKNLKDDLYNEGLEQNIIKFY